MVHMSGKIPKKRPYVPRETPRRMFICKFCKVQVIGPGNFKAVWNQKHAYHCPRRHS
jgi:hypothetical protein